jgi:hypothetical protein
MKSLRGADAALRGRRRSATVTTPARAPADESGRTETLAKLGVPESCHTVIYGVRTESFAFGRAPRGAAHRLGITPAWDWRAMVRRTTPSLIGECLTITGYWRRWVRSPLLLRPVSQANRVDRRSGYLRRPADTGVPGRRALRPDAQRNRKSRARSGPHRLPGPISPTLQAW